MFPEVQSPLNSNTLGSKGSFCEQVLTYQVSASLPLAGDAATETGDTEETRAFPSSHFGGPLIFFPQGGSCHIEKHIRNHLGPTSLG